MRLVTTNTNREQLKFGPIYGKDSQSPRTVLVLDTLPQVFDSWCFRGLRCGASIGLVNYWLYHKPAPRTTCMIYGVCEWNLLSALVWAISCRTNNFELKPQHCTFPSFSVVFCVFAIVSSTFSSFSLLFVEYKRSWMGGRACLQKNAHRNNCFHHSSTHFPHHFPSKRITFIKIGSLDVYL